ncbi:MAG TPA: sulfotransferase domain-containing protein [Rubricoccaceae bacterium]
MTSPRLTLAARYAAGTAALRYRDVLLVCYPRSGSTLLRFVLEHDARLAAGRDGPVDFHDLNAGQPELGIDWLWPRPRAARIVKTHRRFSRALARPHAVLVVRRPLDAVASYHTYWTGLTHTAPVALGDFLRDERRGLPQWIRHTASWHARADAVVRFEAVREDPAPAAALLLRLAGRPADPERLAEASRRAAARHVQRAQADRGLAGTDAFAPGFVFARNLPPGAGTARFSDTDRAWATDRLGRSGLLGVFPDPL